MCCGASAVHTPHTRAMVDVMNEVDVMVLGQLFIRGNGIASEQPCIRGRWRRKEGIRARVSSAGGTHPTRGNTPRPSFCRQHRESIGGGEPVMIGPKGLPLPVWCAQPYIQTLQVAVPALTAALHPPCASTLTPPNPRAVSVLA